MVNNILRNRTDGSLTLTNQTLLQNFKDSIDENFIVDNVNSLELIVDANAENEYYQCDAEINSVLRSRVMPKIPFPDCR